MDIDTCKFISGGVYLQAGGPTSWSSKFQDMVSMLTTGAEYIALIRAVEQIQWMYAALAEIGMPVPNPAELKGVNDGSIEIAENKQNHNRVKHIDVCHYFIRHCVEEGKISIAHVPSSDNPSRPIHQSIALITTHQILHSAPSI